MVGPKNSRTGSRRPTSALPSAPTTGGISSSIARDFEILGDDNPCYCITHRRGRSKTARSQICRVDLEAIDLDLEFFWREAPLDLCPTEFHRHSPPKTHPASVGKLPHGIWPSGDGTRVYVDLENEDRIIAIDTLTNSAVATSPIGQAPQAVVYVPNAIPFMHASDNTAMTRMPEVARTENLQPLGVGGLSTQLWLAPLVESRMGAVAWGHWPTPRFPSPLIGRVGDWRAGLGRCLCSLLPRPFGCGVSQHRDHATFPASATSNAAYGFPSLSSPVCFASRVMGPILLGRLSAETAEPCSH